PDPVRVAEEMAWLDVLSGGRLEMGLVKGAPYEIAPANSNPADLMRRYWEAHDLILKAMSTTDGPFNWEGEFFHYRNVNICPRPARQSGRPDDGVDRAIDRERHLFRRQPGRCLPADQGAVRLGRRLRQSADVRPGRLSRPCRHGRQHHAVRPGGFPAATRARYARDHGCRGGAIVTTETPWPGYPRLLQQQRRGRRRGCPAQHRASGFLDRAALLRR